MEELQEQAFFDEVEARRDDPEMLQEYLDHMGFSEDDAEAFANAAETGDFDAMKDILEDGGMTRWKSLLRNRKRNLRLWKTPLMLTAATIVATIAATIAVNSSSSVLRMSGL